MVLILSLRLGGAKFECQDSGCTTVSGTGEGRGVYLKLPNLKFSLLTFETRRNEEDEMPDFHIECVQLEMTLPEQHPGTVQPLNVEPWGKIYVAFPGVEGYSHFAS